MLEKESSQGFIFSSQLQLATLGWKFYRLDPVRISELLNVDRSKWPQKASELGFSQLSKFLSASPSWYLEFQRDFLWLEKNKGKVVTYWDPEYPSCFKNIAYPPLILTYLGKENPFQQFSFLSVVGSRNPNSLSVQWMERELSEYLKKHSVCLVSGGARGIDQKAHQIAIRCGVKTLCFVPSGLAQLYPSQLGPLAQKIWEQGGGVISQFAPFQEMRKYYFQLRNTLIAVLSQKILIIEARRKSGTYLTAQLALEYGKELKVLPFSPMDPSGLGSLDLIFDGAQILRDAQDI